MVSLHVAPGWVLRFERGELLVESILKFCQKEGIKAAWLNGLGGLAWAELGFYDLDNKTYYWEKLNQPLELLSLEGNIVADEQDGVRLHAHISVSDEHMNGKGGHLKEAEVAGTVEILVNVLPGALTRRIDEKTGLKLLDW